MLFQPMVNLNRTLQGEDVVTIEEEVASAEEDPQLKEVACQ